MPDDHLREVYDLQDQDEIDAYYSAWAGTYDDELTRNGYRTPERCAAALAGFVPAHAAILDVGCGTGMSGRALAAAGFGDISGQDVNAEMLAIARAADVYRATWLSDTDDPFPFEPGTFDALSAIGVIGVGAAPASLLGDALLALAPGGHLVFSYNDHALEHAAYVDALDDALAAGVAEKLFDERGPHLEGLGSESRVYVLRRTVPPRS